MSSKWSHKFVKSSTDKIGNAYDVKYITTCTNDYTSRSQMAGIS